MGERELAAMKQGACLINLSRGFVVDHEALARHLKAVSLRALRLMCFRRNRRAEASL